METNQKILVGVGIILLVGIFALIGWKTTWMVFLFLLFTALIVALIIGVIVSVYGKGKKEEGFKPLDPISIPEAKILVDEKIRVDTTEPDMFESEMNHLLFKQGIKDTKTPTYIIFGRTYHSKRIRAYIVNLFNKEEITEYTDFDGEYSQKALEEKFDKLSNKMADKPISIDENVVEYADRYGNVTKKEHRKMVHEEDEKEEEKEFED